jgi:GGDEF domain-containing protein
VKIVARAQDPELQHSLTAAAAQLGAELILIRGGEGTNSEQMIGALRTHPDILVTEFALGGSLRELRAETRARGTALVVICTDDSQATRATQAQADEWILTPIDPAELVTRLRSAAIRADWGERNNEASRAAEYLRYEELLYDRFTGFPTLPVMMERGREMLDRTGRITILYIEFVRYSKLEEIYGWQKLDEVLQTTANAVREFYDREQANEENLLMVSHAGDDDFIEDQRNRRAARGGPAPRDRGGARRGHCRTLRHLRRRSDHLPQPEDPDGAEHLPGDP